MLEYAQYEFNPEYVTEIIAAGADINAAEENGYTSSLHIATQHHNNEVVDILIELKANLNDQDHEGNTALHYAVITKNKLAAKTLIAVCANPNIKNDYNRTALKIAQDKHDHQMIKILLPTATHKFKSYKKKSFSIKK